MSLSSEICAVSKVSKKEIGRCFKLILRALETTVEQAGAGDFMVRLLLVADRMGVVFVSEISIF